MTIEAWILAYGCQVLVLVWILFFRGAEWLEGTFTSGFLLSVFAPSWSAEGIRLFSWATLVLSTVAFVAGLFEPGVRLAGLL